MWVLLSGRLRTWLIVTFAGPVLGWLLGHLGRRLERRNGGPTRVSNGLQALDRRLRRRARRDAKQLPPDQQRVAG